MPEQDPTAPLRAAEEKIVTLTLKIKGDPSKPGGLGKKFKKFARDIRYKAMEDGLAIIRAEIDAKGGRDPGMNPEELPIDYRAKEKDDVSPWTPAMAKKEKPSLGGSDV